MQLGEPQGDKCTMPQEKSEGGLRIRPILAENQTMQGFERGSCEYPQVIAKTYLQAVGAAGDKRSVTQFATNF